MSSQQSPESAAQTPRAQSDGPLDGGLFLAGVAIGVAPAAAAAGILLESRLVGIGVACGLTLIGLVTAAMSSEL
jgi:hypothetical protein